MRIRHTFFIAAIGIAFVLSAPAAAQTNNDVKCLLVSNLFSNASKDAKARQIAEAAKFFYAGRVYGRLSEAQLKAQMQAQQKLITGKNAGQTMASCAREVQSAGSMLQRVAQQAAPKKT